MDELSESSTVVEAPVTSIGWKQVTYFLAPSKGPGKWELRPTIQVICRKAQCSLAPSVCMHQGQNENCSPQFHREHYKWWGKLTDSYSAKTAAEVRGWMKSVTGWCELVLSQQYLERSLTENTLQQKLPRCSMHVWRFGTSPCSSTKTALRYPRARLAVWWRGGKTHVWSLGSGKK